MQSQLQTQIICQQIYGQLQPQIQQVVLKANDFQRQLNDVKRQMAYCPDKATIQQLYKELEDGKRTYLIAYSSLNEEVKQVKKLHSQLMKELEYITPSRLEEARNISKALGDQMTAAENEYWKLKNDYEELLSGMNAKPSWFVASAVNSDGEAIDPSSITDDSLKIQWDVSTDSRNLKIGNNVLALGSSPSIKTQTIYSSNISTNENSLTISTNGFSTNVSTDADGEFITSKIATDTISPVAGNGVLITNLITNSIEPKQTNASTGTYETLSIGNGATTTKLNGKVLFADDIKINTIYGIDGNPIKLGSILDANRKPLVGPVTITDDASGNGSLLNVDQISSYSADNIVFNKHVKFLDGFDGSATITSYVIDSLIATDDVITVYKNGPASGATFDVASGLLKADALASSSVRKYIDVDSDLKFSASTGIQLVNANEESAKTIRRLALSTDVPTNRPSGNEKESENINYNIIPTKEYVDKIVGLYCGIDDSELNMWLGNNDYKTFTATRNSLLQTTRSSIEVDDEHAYSALYSYNQDNQVLSQAREYAEELFNGIDDKYVLKANIIGATNIPDPSASNSHIYSTLASNIYFLNYTDVKDINGASYNERKGIYSIEAVNQLNDKKLDKAAVINDSEITTGENTTYSVDATQNLINGKIDKSAIETNTSFPVSDEKIYSTGATSTLLETKLNVSDIVSSTTTTTSDYPYSVTATQSLLSDKLSISNLIKSDQAESYAGDDETVFTTSAVLLLLQSIQISAEIKTKIDALYNNSLLMLTNTSNPVSIDYKSPETWTEVFDMLEKINIYSKQCQTKNSSDSTTNWNAEVDAITTEIQSLAVGDIASVRTVIDEIYAMQLRMLPMSANSKPLNPGTVSLAVLNLFSGAF